MYTDAIRFYMKHGIDPNDRNKSLSQWYKSQENFEDVHDKILDFYHQKVDQNQISFSDFKNEIIGAGTESSRFSVVEYNFRDQFIGDYHSLKDVADYLSTLQYELMMESDEFKEPIKPLEEIKKEFMDSANIWAARKNEAGFLPVIINTAEFLIHVACRDILLDVLEEFSPSSIMVNENNEVNFGYKSNEHKNARRYMYSYLWEEVAPIITKNTKDFVNSKYTRATYFIEITEPDDESENSQLEHYTFVDPHYAFPNIVCEDFDGSVNDPNKSVFEYNSMDITEDIEAFVTDEVEEMKTEIISRFERIVENYGNVIQKDTMRVILSDDFPD